MDPETRLKTFLDSWAELVKKGEVSSLSGSECMILTIYKDWEIENEDIC